MSLIAQLVKNHLQCRRPQFNSWVGKIRWKRDRVPTLEEMATHSSVLAWRIPGKVEPDGLSSLGSHRVGHDCHPLLR